MTLYLDAMSTGVTNLGPGRRICIWVQGCTLACRGCMTPELFQRHPASAVQVKELALRIIALAPGHDGLTVSGGEPFQQVEPLRRLLRMIRRHTSLDIMVYSGYTLEEIQAAGGSGVRLLAELDLLMDGRFVLEKTNRKLWRGSDNQRLHLLTPRAERYRWAAEASHGDQRTLHCEIASDGRLRIIGIPERGFSAQLSALAKERGLRLRRGFDRAMDQTVSKMRPRE
jgi:anaerobic ribonucleoside-triphosphate reductase activating protein